MPQSILTTALEDARRETETFSAERSSPFKREEEMAAAEVNWFKLER